MPQRAASPAASEPEIDILGSLYPGNDADEAGKASKGSKTDEWDVDDILDVAGGGLDDDKDDEAFIALKQAASYRKGSNLKGRTVKKGGGFQAMGLNPNLLKAITRKGFSVPTPIQRKTIPLVLDRKDVVGMARTGSGKTAAFVIPMIERLRAHSARFGARALILSPSRELAIQTLKVVKEFSRGTDLKCVLLVGGDSLEEQFSSMSANPDVVIATPGRFLHLKVEMGLDLSSITYMVFDEADRLFEMGFAAQLTEILHALPPSRQTLLFSATLPTSLVEFARAGLQDPSLVRLDAETKVSPDLESAFFSIKGAEKEGALLHLLHDVIKMPTGYPQGRKDDGEMPTNRKRKRHGGGGGSGGGEGGPRKPTEHSTIVFTATKHHVEYIYHLLEYAGFAVSHVYGSLDQTARRNQVDDFRYGKTNILVVTDVAARGIDIPVLANVINYDFPPQPKVFVHRVGRTARAGQRGWSYSLVRDTDAPYLLDLQLFLGKRLVVGQQPPDASFTGDIIVGSLQRDPLETQVEWINKSLHESHDINELRKVSAKAERLYVRTRNSASVQSAKRSKEVVASRGWMQKHQLFGQNDNNDEDARADMLAKISGFRPQETIFEVSHGKKGTTEAAEMMRQLRKRITPRNRQKKDKDKDDEDEGEGGDDKEDVDMFDGFEGGSGRDEGIEEGPDGKVSYSLNDFDKDNMEEALDEEDDDDEFEVTVTNTGKPKKSGTGDDWRDSEVFMSYTPRTINAVEERGYGVHSGGAGSSFVEAARDAAMDLTNDETAKGFGVATRAKMRWDQKSKKYVSRDNDEDGSRGAKMIMGESGVKIAASFQSGRFDKWKQANRLGKLPRVGDTERPGAGGPGGGGIPSGVRYKHKQEKAPKEADKYRDDFHQQKKRLAEARDKRIGRFRDGMGNKKELKGMDDVRRARVEKEKKLAKNARPSKKNKKQ